MITRQLVLPLRLPGLNDLWKESRWKSARSKERLSQAIYVHALAQKFQAITKPAHFEYHFIEKDRKRDPSNVIAGGIKIIEDALVLARLLPNDGWAWVRSIQSSVAHGPEYSVRVVVREDETEH